MKHIIVKGKENGTIVFIHGNSSSSDVFKKVMQYNTLSHTKIAVNLPGHHMNLDGFTHIEDFSFASYCNKLISFINKIEDDILLVGNSLGGHLAIEIANSVKRLKGLIIFGTPPLKKPLNLAEAFLPVAALQTFFTENPTPSEIIDAANVSVFNKENAFKITEYFKKANPLVRKAIGIDIAEGNFSDQLQLFKDLEIPKYIIAGDNDPCVNRPYLDAIENNCNGSCELIAYEKCGHYPSLEKPKEFISSIEKIVSKIF